MLIESPLNVHSLYKKTKVCFKPVHYRSTAYGSAFMVTLFGKFRFSDMHKEPSRLLKATHSYLRVSISQELDLRRNYS